MPRTPNSPRERSAIAGRLLTLWGSIDVNDLHDAIHLRLAGHPRAASYEPRVSSHAVRTILDPSEDDDPVKLTTTEAAASDHRAADDLAELAKLLGQADHIEQRLVALRNKYPTWTGAPVATDPRLCPPGMCRDHWAAGIFDVPADPPRYKHRARVCGEWFGTYRQAMPAPIVRVYNERGRRGITTDLLKQHAPYALVDVEVKR